MSIELNEEERRLALSGFRVDAIKAVRARVGVEAITLSECLTLVNNVRDQQPPSFKDEADALLAAFHGGEQ